MNDPRVEETLKIVESLITKSLLKYTKIMITESSMAIIIVNDTLLYIVPLKAVVGFYPAIAFTYSDIEKFENASEYNLNDLFLINEMKNALKKYELMRDANRILAVDDNLRGNEEFESLLNLTADQGMRFYRMPGLELGKLYLIPMFAGFISLSKQDTIGMKVYDADGIHLMLEMNIFKKKINRNIQMYCLLIRV